MESKGRLVCFLILNFLVSSISTSATPVDVTTYTWFGISAYIAVQRQAVLDKLALIYNKNPNAPKLFLPSDPVFSDLLSEGQHVMYVDFGIVKSLDPSNVSIYAQMSLAIPLLSTTENGPPNYALSIAKIVQKRKNGTPFKPEILYPYIKVDRLIIGEKWAAITDGMHTVLNVTFNKTRPCQRSSVKQMDEFNEYILHSDTLRAASSDPEFCKNESSKGYCKTLNGIAKDALPNVCTHTSADFKEDIPCQVSMDVVHIDPYFRTLLLLGSNSEPINVVAAQEYIKTRLFRSSLKYPCVTTK